MNVTEAQKHILTRLHGVSGHSCRIDKFYPRPSEADLAALTDGGLIEHRYTRPMLVRKDHVGPSVIEAVAVYGITDLGKRWVSEYWVRADRERLRREGRLAS